MKKPGRASGLGRTTFMPLPVLVKVVNSLLLASDQGCISLLILIKFGAAFHTIHPNIVSG